MEKKWYTIGVEEILDLLKTSLNGLTTQEAQYRLKKYGYNEILTKKKTSPIIIFLRQFLNPLVYLLIVASVIKFSLGKYLDANVILGVLLFMAIVGFIQEFRAEKAMEALKQLASPKAKVKRNSQIELIPSNEVVVGDIIILESGDKVPSDARIIESASLKVNESILTGESVAVDKFAGVIKDNVGIVEQKNMLFMGTTVVYGRTIAVVTATGMSTEIGKIAFALKEIKQEQTPLQKSIHNLGKGIIIVILCMTFILSIIGISKGMNWIDVFMISVALMVAAAPEGLPATITVILSIGMQMMAKRNAIIRKLVAVETLGSTTVICSDKTGTLTLNQMTLKRIYDNERMILLKEKDDKTEFFYKNKTLDVNNDDILKLIFEICVLCNDASLKFENNNINVIGDQMEGALLISAKNAGITKESLEIKFKRISEIPFQSENQYMATLYKKEYKNVAYVKGSPEKVLSLCNYITKNEKIIPLTEEIKSQISLKVELMAKDALRVIALAYCDLGQQNLTEESIKGKLVFSGLVGLIDPPRPEAINSVKLCQQAGIKVVMITGDNKLTAQTIAKEVGIQSDEVITGQELEELTEDELAKKIKQVSVFARIEPLHKLKIVNAFKKLGNVVAMTGDGVNDAPALETADIGVAMGITGTDVAKESADMILADDNFATIVSAVEEGRAIFNRLRNATGFLLTTCFGELFTLIFSVIFTGISPLLPVQILWINLVTGAIMSIPLGLEPKFGNELQFPPRHYKVGLIYPGMIKRIAFLSLALSLGSFLVYIWSLKRFSIEETRTIVFLSVVIFEWFLAFNMRSDEISVFKLGLFKNPALIKGLIVAIILQLGVIYVGIFRTFFDTVILGYKGWIVAILPGLSIFILETLRKTFFPKLFSKGKWQPI